MSSLSQRYDVIIVGGGMVGASLAIALAQAQMRVALVEKTPTPERLEPAFDGRVSAIAYGSKAMLAGIGAWPRMAPHAEPIWDIRVSDGQAPFFLHYDHAEIGREPFGYIIENRHTRIALHETAKALPTLHLHEGHGVHSLERLPGQVRLELENGEVLEAALVIGADGKHSRMRTLLGIEATSWDYRQSAIVCTISHENPHHGLAQERFLPAGPFAVLPMQANRSSLVWVEPQDRIPIYMELPESELLQEITERVGGYLGKLTLEGPRFTYPLGVLHARSYIAHRACLIGDAAHAIHPIAGQGVNMGFRDVGVLAELLTARHRLGQDLGSEDTLAHYQRWRRFDNTTMVVVTDTLNRLFGSSLLPVKLARGLGLWGVSRLPPLKRLFMRH
ncbi:MAG: UbiH/UbiF/VisC/COQ6 family ubiquinone biosynthesis hydroxylase, partial [Rickettsiales bacterium]|nr:UbiH/UbiF/VisC/COQ6 family ubiquinone biosynthesis hydroxylase [Rickettsiales bacterium]